MPTDYQLIKAYFDAEKKIFRFFQNETELNGVLKYRMLQDANLARKGSAEFEITIMTEVDDIEQKKTPRSDIEVQTDKGHISTKS